MPGLTSTSDCIYVQNFVDDAYQRGSDVVVVNHRGLAGCDLSTPSLYSYNNTDDLREPMKYVYEKFVKPFNRKYIGIGCSLGAHKMCCLLGEDGDDCLLDAACCV
jgi:predicted alpha/beta-fold hydrolase